MNHAGAGKTLIAAEVIRRKLPALKAATKAVLFMAPTNPLVAQVGVHMCWNCPPVHHWPRLSVMGSSNGRTQFGRVLAFLQFLNAADSAAVFVFPSLRYN